MSLPEDHPEGLQKNDGKEEGNGAGEDREKKGSLCQSAMKGAPVKKKKKKKKLFLEGEETEGNACSIKVKKGEKRKN